MSDPATRRMQVKVLYSFDNSPTVFLSRLTTHHQIKVAQVPGDNDVVTLGAFDLKSCVLQIVRSSPEHFRLHTHDYAVYYKDVTEQPDEPFVAGGVASALLGPAEPLLVPGRVCQNVLALFLFGDSAALLLTLEVRLKLHQTDQAPQQQPPPQQPQTQPQHGKCTPAKATRTKSLPIFVQPPSHHISSIINADRLNAAPRHDPKRILERFNLAPFLLAKIIDKPARRRRRSNAPLTPSVRTPVDALRATRTRLMVSSFVLSPIHEDVSSDDTDYHEPTDTDTRDYSPATFEALPDLEDLDSKRTHTVAGSRLPPNHGLACVNRNCGAQDLVTWRYFETKYDSGYLQLQRSGAATFDKAHYDGMFGPLCNACFLFLRNKGFMRPEAVVKKYVQQQKYKRDAPRSHKFATPTHTPAALSEVIRTRHARHADAATLHASAQGGQTPSTSTVTPTAGTTPGVTPGVTPLTGQTPGRTPQQGQTPDYLDLNDFMNQLNSFGGPLTDIDLPQDLHHGSTPPMMATKSNTRVISLYDDDDDKENCPPETAKSALTDFEQMMIKSFSLRSSPDQNEWTQFFGDHTPKDNDVRSDLPPQGIFKSSPAKPEPVAVGNMPSSPVLSGKHVLEASSPSRAVRTDTTMSFVHRKSSPQSEVFPDDDKALAS